MKKDVSIPDLQFNVFLVKYGYQLDVIYPDGKGREICRDFSGNYKVSDIKRIVEQEILKVFMDLEKNLKKG